MKASSRKKKPVTAVAPWYGSNRMLAEHVGRELAGCAWVGVAFAGGMCEVPQIDARTINVNDLHRHLINLGSVIAHPTLGPKLYRHLRRVPFHPDALAAAQNRCRERERCHGDADELFATGNGDYRFDGPNVEWAIDYFIVAWMSRHGTAGTPGEFTGGISTRWDAGGGDSAAHFQGAVRSLPMWRRTLRRCNFTTLDCFEFLDSCKDGTQDFGDEAAARKKIDGLIRVGDHNKSKNGVVTFWPPHRISRIVARHIKARTSPAATAAAAASAAVNDRQLTTDN